MLVGDFLIWLHESLAGIKADLDQPGFKHILMKPEPLAGISFARASHRSPYGAIRSEWKQDGGKFEWKITIPPNTTASVWIPCTDRVNLKEAGLPLDKSPGVTLVSMQDNRAMLELTAGNYTFESK